MNTRPKVGLLPLYLQLYDDVRPEAREHFTPFVEDIARRLSEMGLEVITGGIARLEPEVRAAVDDFARRGADLLITLHLAYSPSLESAGSIAESRLPVLLLDTTMDAEFGLDVAPDRIMYNHGIHGVQDLACVLRRMGKSYHVVAGHVTESRVLERVAAIGRAAFAASRLRNMRALRIGESFRGMGDFAVREDVLARSIGAGIDTVDTRPLAAAVQDVTPREVEEELERDRSRFTVEAPDDVHRRSVRVGLGLRRLLDTENYGAVSVNFLAFDSADGPVDTVPFLEASKAMARGLGYAGEGDVLTAFLVGALASGFGRTTFTEMFCPDWRGESVFLSHMGEFNPDCAGERPRIVEKDFPWTPACNPAILTASPKPGPALLVNLAPSPHDALDLIVAPVEVLADAERPEMRDGIRGWIRPAVDLTEFLEAYSRLGGTHHCALVHDGDIEALTAFADFAGLPCSIISGKSA